MKHIDPGEGAPPSLLDRPDGETLAFHHLPGATPGILFCTGFHSNMNGEKALALEAFCRETGRQMTRFDYYGHGESSGDIQHGTIGRWREDTLTILEQVTLGPQIIVGSSMGGWMMLLAALARPERVAALVGIAIAPDLTQDLEERRLNVEQKTALAEQGWCDLANAYDDQQPYRIRREMLDEARRHTVLDGEIPIDAPVRLLHGLADEDVPWQRSLAAAQRLRSKDAELILIKDGDHRLSTPRDLARLTTVVTQLLEDSSEDLSLSHKL